MSAGSRWPALPENWKATKLKRVASLRAGEAIASEAVAAYGEYPVFGGNGIRGYTTSYTHDGTFALVGRQGALCGNVNYASGRFWASEHAVVVMPMEGSDIFWLGELLRAMDLNQYSQSAAQPGLSVEMVEQLEIPVPPRATQRAIAEYLSRETARIDDLIAAEQSRACLAEEWELSKTQSLVLGREDSLARVNRPEGPLSPVPGGWGFHRNKTFLAEVTDLSESGNEELLTVSHITGVTSRAEKDVNMFLAESNEGYKRVAPDDLVINTMWAWMGALGVSSTEGIVSPAYGVYRFSRGPVDVRYFDALFRSPAYVAEMTRYSKGVWTSRLRLYPEYFLALRTPVPPLSVQTRIGDEIEEVREEVRRVTALLARSIDLLKERRQALITAAVTGQIEIPEAA